MHFQSSTPNWPVALLKLPDYCLVKSVDNPSLLREAKQRWIAAGRDPKKLFTVYRHSNVFTAPESDWNGAVAHWDEMYRRWVDATYLKEYAQWVDFVSESNEYTSETTWQDKSETAKALQNMKAATWVWKNRFQGKEVSTSDGGKGIIPETTRLAIMAGPVANRFPREVIEIALEYDFAVDYHSYTKYSLGVRDPTDWEKHSGLWNTLEHEYNLKPIWLFGESGPYLDQGGGWRDNRVLASQLSKLVNAFESWALDTIKTNAYQEGRLRGLGAWFTIGHDFGWPDYEMEEPQLSAIADMLNPIWKPGEFDMDIVKYNDLLKDLVSMRDTATQALATLATITPKHELSTLTNQQILNLFQSAFPTADYYDNYVTRAGLASIAFHRLDSYTGAAIEDMTLTDAEKGKLIAKL